MPPVPADTAVALGAFLAARGAPISVWGVYAVTLVANVITASGMFLLAGRYGKGMLRSKLMAKVLSDRHIANIERAYEKHHWWGLFVSRFLPGYRALVPPFAAAMGLPARKALPPVIIATALYYGIIVFLAYRVGENWEAVKGLVASVGTGLLVLAIAASVGVVWFVRRRRHHHDGA